MEDKEKYLIDVAKEKTYQNQFDDYHREFSKWRTKKGNPYGYSFVHDTREHTYVDGEGYFQKTAAEAERKALTKCLSLLGVTMLVMLAFDGLTSLMFYRLFRDAGAYSVYYTQIGQQRHEFTPLIVLLYCCTNLLKYLLGFWIFIHFSKIPIKVAAPMPKGAKLSKSGIFLMLVLMVFGRLSNYIIKVIFGFLNFDCVYSVSIHVPDSILSDSIYLVFNCILISIVSELLFRGAIMQTFRQFGDIYALIVSAVTFSLTYYDISSIGYGVLCSAALGLFTLRTGSLKSAIVMRVTASVSNYALTRLVLDNFNYGRLIEAGICAFIMTVAAFIFARLMCNGKWAFTVKSDPSELSGGEKLKTTFTGLTMVLWLIGVLGLIFLTARFI